MAVFRIERTKDYTVMSNHHLKDPNLSLKSKGLLSMMFSFPDERDYSTRGLAAICKEGVDAIGSALKELEKAGYITRRQIRGSDGKISDTEYTIYEQPHLPDTASPDTALPYTENPDMDSPYTEEPRLENPAQLNTKQSSTQKSNTNESSTHSILPPAPSRAAREDWTDGMTDGRAEREDIKEQIEYDILRERYRGSQLDELVELMLEVRMCHSRTIRFGKDNEYSADYVRQRFSQITAEHISMILDNISENTTEVRNSKAYLMAALFNSVSTMDNHYTMRVNHDLYGS